jgi:hypothetical protein
MGRQSIAIVNRRDPELEARKGVATILTAIYRALRLFHLLPSGMLRA